MFGRPDKRDRLIAELREVIAQRDAQIRLAEGAGRELEKQRNDMTDLYFRVDAERKQAEKRAARLSQVIVEQEALIRALERRDAGEQVY